MFCVPAQPMHAYYPRAFDDNSQQLSCLSFKTAPTELTIIFFLCFSRATEHRMTNFHLLSRVQALAGDGLLRANEEELMLRLCEIRPDNLKRGPLRICYISVGDLVSPVLSFARAGETDWVVPSCQNWFCMLF